MSDPHRLSRGKRYAKDGSVLDIVVEPGVVTCEVQGSRSTPYLASIEVTPGDGMPLRRDVSATCTCPDADNWDGHICKHVVATLFTLADELLIEPELLDLWRGRERPTDEVAPVAPRDRPGSRRDRVPGPSAAPDTGPDTGPDRAPDGAPVPDALSDFLAAPEDLPRVPHLERLDPDPPRRPELAAVLRDALGRLRIDWD
jgi:hypothetical protein